MEKKKQNTRKKVRRIPNESVQAGVPISWLHFRITGAYSLSFKNTTQSNSVQARWGVTHPCTPLTAVLYGKIYVELWNHRLYSLGVLAKATEYNNIRVKAKSRHPMPCLRDHLWDKDTASASDSMKCDQEGSFIPSEDIAENKFHLWRTVFT